MRRRPDPPDRTRKHRQQRPSVREVSIPHEGTRAPPGRSEDGGAGRAGRPGGDALETLLQRRREERIVLDALLSGPCEAANDAGGRTSTRAPERRGAPTEAERAHGDAGRANAEPQRRTVVSILEWRIDQACAALKRLYPPSPLHIVRKLPTTGIGRRFFEARYCGPEFWDGRSDLVDRRVTKLWNDLYGPDSDWGPF